MTFTRPSRNDGILTITSRGGKVILYAWGLKETSKSLRDLRILLTTPKGTYSLKARKVTKWKKKLPKDTPSCEGTPAHLGMRW